jgi:thioredoxin 1
VSELGELRAVTEADFDAVVLGSELPVLVVFTMADGGPCESVLPTLRQVAGEYAGRLLVVTVDTPTNPALTRTYDARAVPLMLLFEDGVALRYDRLIGNLPASTMRTMLDKHRPKTAGSSPRAVRRPLAAPPAPPPTLDPLVRVESGRPLPAVPGGLFAGHLGAATALAVGPGGVLASAGRHDGIRLWRLADGAPLAHLDTFLDEDGEPSRVTGEIRALAFAPGGTRLLVAGPDPRLQSWALRPGEPLEYPLGSVAPVMFVGCTGSTIVVVEEAGTVTVQGDDAAPARYESGLLFVRAAALSANGATVAVIDSLGTLVSMDTATGRAVRLPGDAVAPVVAVSGDGSVIFAALQSRPELIRRFSARSSRSYTPDIVAQAEVRALAASADRHLVFTADAGGEVAAWPLRAFPRAGDFAAPGFGASAIVESTDPPALVVGCETGEIVIVDEATFTPRAALRGHRSPSTALAVTPDGNRVLSAGPDGRVRTVELADGRESGAPALVHQVPLTAVVAAGPASEWIVVGDARGQVRRERDGESVTLPAPSGLAAVTRLAASPDGALVAAGYADGWTLVWHCGLAELAFYRLALPGSRQPVTALAFGADGRSLLIASDCVRRVLGAGEEVDYPDSADVCALAATADATIVTIASPDSGTKRLSVRRADDGTPLAGWTYRARPFETALVVRPDGCAATRSGPFLRVHDLRTGRASELFDFIGEGPGVITPDGLRVIYARADGSLGTAELPAAPG